MTNQTNLAQKITNYREAQDMTQAELADKSGIERTALNKIEKGTRKVSSDELKDTYADIARGYFKRHPEYLNKN